MTELHSRYDRRADVLYLFTEENGPASSKEDELGILWRYVPARPHPVGATIIDFRELWSGRLDELVVTLSRHFRVPAKRAEKALTSLDG